eukprot:g3710.t1
MLLLVLAALLAVAQAGAPGTQVQRTLTVTDPDSRLGDVQRKYDLALPYATADDGVIPLHADEGGTNATATTYGVVWYFHGQLGRDGGAAALSKLGAKEGFITVAPQGLGDGSLSIDTTWSVKAEGRTDVCKRVLPQFVMTSCRTVKRISACNWATCYDDVHFVKELLAELQDTLKLPLDASRMYMTGLSNGGMFLDYLQTQMPGTFKAAVPWYGAFLTTYLTADNAHTLGGTALLSLHGAKDALIPPAGGLDTQAHYLYISEQEMVARWAAANGCAATAQPAATPFDGAGYPRAMRHSCVEYPRCKSGAVMYCTFPEQAHGFWPSYAEQMVWWFASQKT